MNDGTHAEHPVIGYGTFVAVWGVLLVLTFALVGANALLPAAVGAVATLVITPVKAGLVFYYFMHLKYEGTLLKTMVFIFLASLVVFIGMGKTVLRIVLGVAPPDGDRPPYRETLLTLLPVIVFMAATLLLGLYLPPPLRALLDNAARFLENRP